MADITKVSRLVGAFQRQVDLQQNALVVGSLKVGSSSPTELTKALLDSLLAISTDLASTASGKGASLIGIQDAANQYTATTVEGALTESLDAAQAAQSDADAAQADATQALADAAAAQSDADAAQADATQALADAAAAQSDADAAQADATQALADAAAAQADATQALADAAAAQATADAAIPLTQKGAASGVATLDGGGKVPLSQLPSSIMEYKGVWNATTNSPSLSDFASGAAAGSAVGDVYRVSVAGSQDLGSGSISFDVGDYAILNSSGKWEKSDTTDAVASVNGFTGVVSLSTSNIAEGSNLYYTSARFDTALATKSTSNLTEGSNLYYTQARFDSAIGAKSTSDLSEGTNLYHTTARARAAAVVNSTAGSETDQAASVAAMKSYVTTQIATKDQASEISYSNSTSGMAASTVQAAIDEVEARVDTLEAGAVALKRSVPAGEAMAATSLFAVRWGRPADSETAGRVYKADNDATSVDNFTVAGLVLTVGAATAGTSVSMTKVGKLIAASHGFTVGKPIWLGASGALTSTAPTAASTAAVMIGYAEDSNTIDVQIQVNGVN